MQIKKIAKILIVLSCFIFLAIYIDDNFDSFFMMSEIDFLSISVIFFLYLIYFLNNSFILKIGCRDYGGRCSFNTAYEIAVKSSFLSYVTFMKVGSSVYKLYALDRYCGLSFKKSIGVILLQSLFLIAVNIFLLFLFLFFLEVRYALVFSIMSCMLLFFVVFFRRFFLSFVRSKIDFIYISSVNVFFCYVLLFLCQAFMGAVITYCLFDSLSLFVSFEKCLLITLVSSLSLLVSITPANLGVKEVFYVALGGVISIDGDAMLIMAVLDRCIQFAFLFFSVALFFIKDCFLKLYRQ